MGGRLYLVLANGQVFEGRQFGADINDAVGEVVFTTAMTGYTESLTDPSYCGQLLVQTFPEIGNYGVSPGDFESDGPHLGGYIVSGVCDSPSHFLSEESVDSLLKRHGVPGLCGVDARQITRTIRDSGTMNGVMTRDPESVDLKTLQNYRLKKPVELVSCGSRTTYGSGAKKKVAVWDFGVKRHIIEHLLMRGVDVVKLPHSATCADVLAERPDGVLLSNGPGDPLDNMGAIAEIRELTKSGLPMCGICLGHQLLALARGASTAPLKFGHRGANQPVRDTTTGRVYITNQNHGYQVMEDSLKPGMSARYINLFDGSIEGIDYRDFPAFSVQFHPESPSGPKDTEFLFDRFVGMMGS